MEKEMGEGMAGSKILLEKVLTQQEFSGLKRN